MEPDDMSKNKESQQQESSSKGEPKKHDSVSQNTRSQKNEEERINYKMAGGAHTKVHHTRSYKQQESQEKQNLLNTVDIGVLKIDDSATRNPRSTENKVVLDQHSESIYVDPKVLLTISDQTSADFELLIKSSMFVDKTATLSNLFTTGSKWVITAPTRFGKSTMISMARTFFERLPMYIEGRPTDFTQHSNYQYFEGLAIANYPEYMEKHFGRYPVLYVDFSSGEIENREQALDVVRDSIHEAYVRHEYLLSNGKFPKSRKKLKKIFTKWCDETAYMEIPKKYVMKALKVLTVILKLVYKENIYLLIDEYDSIMNQALGSVSDNELVNICNMVVESYKLLIKGEYADKNVRGAIITGISYITGLGLSRVNNIFHCPFLGNSLFNSFFGLDQLEVEELYRQLGIKEKCRKIISHHNNGYRRTNGSTFYNPWAMYQCFRTGIIGNFWVQNCVIKYLDCILKVDTLKEDFQTLVSGGSVSFQYQDKVDEKAIRTLNEIMSICVRDPKFKISTAMKDVALSYYMEQGYFTITEHQGNCFEVELPNYEITDSLRRSLSNHYYITYLRKDEHADQCEKLIIEMSGNYQKLEQFEKSIKCFFHNFSCVLAKCCQKDRLQMNEAAMQCLLYAIFHQVQKSQVSAECSFKSYKIEKKDSKLTIEHFKHAKRIDVTSVIEKLWFISELKFNIRTNRYAAIETLNEREYLRSGVIVDKLRKCDYCVIVGIHLILPEVKNAEDEEAEKVEDENKQKKEHAELVVNYQLREMPESFKNLNGLTGEERDSQLIAMEPEVREFIHEDVGQTKELTFQIPL